MNISRLLLNALFCAPAIIVLSAFCVQSEETAKDAGGQHENRPGYGTQSSLDNKNMVWIEGGALTMRGDDGKSDREIPVKGFYMDSTEVTQEEYKRVTGINPSRFKDCPTCPVEQISWHDAGNYCKKIGKRLPTEAEWEYACRAGGAGKYYWGDVMNGDHAWHFENAGKKTHPVGTRKPNKFGLHDMSGNVYEWCSDEYRQKYYGKNTVQPPEKSAEGNRRIFRGGSWSNHFDGLGCAIRAWDIPEELNNNVGFRCAR